MTSQQMTKTKCPPGHIFWNTARLGAKPNWKIVPAPKGWGHG
jgi:hypothetical protein